MILLPSFGRSVSDFNELAIGLSEAGHRTIAWPPRGIDGSTLPSGEIDLLDSAGDVLAVLDAELFGTIDSRRTCLWKSSGEGLRKRRSRLSPRFGFTGGRRRR